MKYYIKKYEEPYEPLNKNYPDEVMKHWWLGDDKKFREAVRNYDNYYGTILPEAEITASKTTPTKTSDWTSEHNVAEDNKKYEQAHQAESLKIASAVSNKMNEVGNAIGTTALIGGMTIPALVASPIAFAGGMVGGLLGAKATDKVVDWSTDGKHKTWADWLVDKADTKYINNNIAEILNPGALVGGTIGGIFAKPAASWAYRNGKYAYNTKFKGVAGTPKSHLLGDDAVKMFKEYSKDYVLPTTETENIRQLRAYIPEVRERYGLIGNNKVSDDDILKALYKQVSELDGGTAARNIDGEPQLLFRGDTKRYTTLVDHTTAPTHGEDLLLGTLFLGETPISGGGWGADRYLWKYDLYGNIIPVANSGVELAWSTQVVPVLKLDVFADDAGRAIFLYPNTKHQTVASSRLTGDIKKIPNQFMKDGYSNDLNAFVVRTKNVRDISDEVSTAMDLPDNKIRPDWFNFSESPIEGHYKSIVQSAKNKNLGLMRAKKHSPYRDEHEKYTYMVVPDFNKQNVKHILPYDFRIPRNWNDPNIYKSALPLIGIGGVGLTLGNNTESYKQGGPIHIKEKNKGKFTESAKRAGKSVQEHARDIVNNPKATKLQKKRALFALNAKKFKH